MADLVTIRNPDTLEERQVNPTAARFFAGSGWVVLDAAGRVKAKQPTTASDNQKEN